MSWFRDSGLTKRKKFFISPQNAYLQEVNVVPSLAFKMTLTSPSRTSKKRVLSSIFFTILFPLHGLFFTRVMTTKCILTLIFGDSTNWYDPFASRQLRSWVPSGTRSCCPHTFTDAPNILMMLLSNHACGKQSVAHGLSNGTQENYLFYSIARSHRWTRTRAAQLILWYMSLLERVYLFHSLIIVQPLPDIPYEIAKACNNVTVIFRDWACRNAFWTHQHISSVLSTTWWTSWVASTDGLACHGWWIISLEMSQNVQHEDLLQEDYRLQNKPK